MIEVIGKKKVRKKREVLYKGVCDSCGSVLRVTKDEVVGYTGQAKHLPKCPTCGHKNVYVKVEARFFDLFF